MIQFLPKVWKLYCNRIYEYKKKLIKISYYDINDIFICRFSFEYIQIFMMNVLPFFPDSSKDDVQAYLDSKAPLLRLLEDDYEEEKQAFNACLLALGMNKSSDVLFPQSKSNPVYSDRYH